MPARRLVALLVLVAAWAAPPAAQAVIPGPLSQWIGLPGLNAASGAQWVRSIAYSTPPNVVYAGLEGGGVFRSTTGGATWSSFNSGFPNPLTTNVRALLASSTGTTVYAGTDSGIWKSTGGAWQPLAQGPEDDPANPKKLNQSVQSLLSSSVPNIMLAGVFSGGVYKSTDGGATWTPPPANSGMPASETVYGLTENVPGLVYATAGSGVYLSTNQGTTWTRVSDGIPGSASPITTWVYPQRPQVLFTSTGSNGIYRSVNAGVTWSAINDGLGAVRARGLQILTSAQGAHVYAATENGLWESLTSNAINPPAPKWHKVTDTGLNAGNIMWSLTAPVIPGAGALGLIAGTQSNGGYFLAFEPPDNACSTSSPTTAAPCPVISDQTPTEGQVLTVTSGTWTGTPIIDYDYQWQSCTTSSSGSCSDIDGADESSYVVPLDAIGLRYRVKVTATNPAPSFGTYVRHTALTGATAGSPTTVPGYDYLPAPGIVVLPPGSKFSPEVGDSMQVTGVIFLPAATSLAYQWLRCDGSGSNCVEVPGATGSTYVLKTADGTHTMRVRVRGTNGSGSAETVSDASYYVISSPAALAAPGQAPSLFGTAYVGETLAGSVGGWKDPTTDFERRWVRCDADGNACSYIQKVGSTDPEDGSTYVVRDSDVGSTLRMRVTADVNNDLTPDGLDNHLPKAVEIDTPPSAVAAFRPVPPAPGGGGGGGGGGGDVGGASDTIAPTVTGLRLTKTSFVAGKGTTFKLRLSEAGALRVVISHSVTGRKVGTACRPTTRKNRKRKKCKYEKTDATIRRSAAAGDLAIAFSGKIGKRKLARGTYRATFVVTDAGGNVSKASSLVFKIVRR